MALTWRVCLQGLTKAAGAVEDGLQLVRLWTHEVLRVFYDRLVDDQDRLWVGTQLTELTEKHFKEKVRRCWGIWRGGGGRGNGGMRACGPCTFSHC